MKRVITVIILILVVFSVLLGCRSSWSPADAHANNSLLGISPVPSPRHLILMEEDAFGRKMYFYGGSSSAAYTRIYDDGNLWAILIQQKTDNKYVYYYPDFSFIVQKWPESVSWHHDQLLEEVREIMTVEAIETLKVQNDWGQPINESQLIKSRIARRNGKGIYADNLIPKSALQKVYDKMCIYGSPRIEAFFDYLTSDDYDRHICFFRTADIDWNITNYYVVMFKPDNSYEIAEIFDLWNYQEELKAFKEGNDWGNPWE